MKTSENISKLLYDLLTIDRTTQSIDNGVLTIVQNGQSISLPLNFSNTIRQTNNRF
jgi:hypothetical protein